MDQDDTPLAPGLYLVATPIGNLGDMTLRALDVLRRADRIACEDTRQTQKLLNHFQIKTPTISVHEHNERARAPELIENLKAGQRIAVVSDAGIPGINDPGALLVRDAIAAGIAIIPIPGANAALSALVASGLPMGEFEFLGFLPEKSGARRTRIEKLAATAREAPRTLIFYEAPHRILDTLSDIEALWGATIQAVVARELTKVHEEFLRGTVAEVRRALGERERIRGEFVLLIEAPTRSQVSESRPGAPSESASIPGLQKPETLRQAQGGLWGTQISRESISARVARLQSEAGIDEKEALKRLAREVGQSKSALYRELQRERARRK